MLNQKEYTMEDCLNLVSQITNASTKEEMATPFKDLVGREVTEQDFQEIYNGTMN